MVKLFYEGKLLDFFKNKKAEVKSAINKISGDKILHSDNDEYCKYLVSEYRVVPIDLCCEKAYLEEPKEVDVLLKGEGFNEFIEKHKPEFLPGSHMRLKVPFTGEAVLLRLQPTSYSISYINAIIKKNLIILDYQVPSISLNKDVIDAKMREDFKAIERMLQYQRRDIENFNINILPVLIEECYTSRKKRLSSGIEVASSLSFPMRRKNTKELVFLPLKKKRVVKIPSVNNTLNEKNYELSHEEYEYILSIVNNMGDFLQRSSQAIRNLNEEDLRMLFLAILNSHYCGQATGETFNKSGKTDIIVMKDGKVVFISECKIWKGSKNFLKGICQLLNYLAWNDTKTSYIVFCRDNSFSKIIKKATTVIKKHAKFKSKVKNISNTCIQYKFININDDKKELFLTLHLFHVPKEVKDG